MASDVALPGVKKFSSAPCYRQLKKNPLVVEASVGMYYE